MAEAHPAVSKWWQYNKVTWTKSWQDAPGKPAYLKVAFEKGLPVSVNGEPCSPSALIWPSR